MSPHSTLGTTDWAYSLAENSIFNQKISRSGLARINHYPVAVPRVLIGLYIRLRDPSKKGSGLQIVVLLLYGLWNKVARLTAPLA